MNGLNNETLEAVIGLDSCVKELIDSHRSLKQDYNNIKKEEKKLKNIIKHQEEEILELKQKLSVVSTAKSVNHDNEEVQIMKQQIEQLIKLIDESLALIK